MTTPARAIRDAHESHVGNEIVAQAIADGRRSGTLSMAVADRRHRPHRRVRGIDWLSLPRVASTLNPGGVLSIVLQPPSASTPAVTPSAFVRLQSLESLLHFVEPGRSLKRHVATD